MLMQAVDQMICEVCMINEYCYLGVGIANEEWREGMRKALFNAVKGNAKLLVVWQATNNVVSNFGM